MSFQVLSPQYDNAKKCYIFTFKNAPKIEEITSDPTRLNITEEDLTELFVREFLQQASKYFSKALDLSAFLKRLTYEWNTEEVEQKEGESFRATWIPARVVFYTGRYELSLNLVELENNTKVPPGFLNDLGVPGEEVSPEPESELPELPIAEIKEDIIPFGKMSSEEKAARELARKRIRQARLRASLAQLKAEAMADRYYKRYGNFDMEDSESELSSEEER
jgi:hypothetical protein